MLPAASSAVGPMSDGVTRARELLAKATPGPWEAATCHESEQETRSEYVRNALLKPEAPAHGLWMVWKPDSPLGVHLTAVTGDGPHGEADADLIAAAPTLLAELVAEVERLTPACSGCRCGHPARLLAEHVAGDTPGHDGATTQEDQPPTV